MRVARDLLTVADFGVALMDEALASRPLVPHDGPMDTLWLHKGADEWAHRRCSVEFAPVPSRVVSVRKQRHGVRPVAELCVRDRVLYRALVNRWSNFLPEPDRSGGAWDGFRNAPLQTATAPNYVVSSDVTAYYQYVDHGLLAREILARTGDSDGVEALAGLLAGLVGRSYGLPQQSGSSDVLAEAYLSIVERRLLRQGLSVWRYNDDFRIAANSWSDALNAVDSLERECREMGLALNDSKTIIRLRNTYAGGLDRREKLLDEISDEVEMNLAGLTLSYVGDVIEVAPDPGDVTPSAARQVIDDWYGLAQRENSISEDERGRMEVLAELLSWALTVMRQQPTDPDVLRSCGLMLRTEQVLTPQVARYLERADDEPAMAVDWFEDFLGKNPYLTPWQAWWVAPALRGIAGSYGAGSSQRAWLDSIWKDPKSPEPVIAGLALTMAEKGLASADDLVRMFDGMTEIGRPYVARALGSVAAPGHAGAQTLIAEDEWVQWAFEVGRP